MADYLVLEEDGTSLLELEESTDGFLLEESSPHERSVAVAAFASVETEPDVDVPPALPATWKVGTITVPSATGTMAVTGLGGEPKAIVFYGTNWLTEDTAVTTTGTGVFRGMCAPKYDDPGTLLQNAAALSPAGDQHHEEDAAIFMKTTAGTAATLYDAIVTSFDSDGFTLNWLVAAAGGYKVTYVALMDTAECGAYRGGDTTLSLGWKAGASLLHGSWGGPVVAGDDHTREFYGGAAYPGTFASGWFGAGLTAFAFPGSISTQYITGLFNNLPNVSVALSGGFVGPFLSPQNVVAYPAGTGLTDLTVTFGADQAGLIVAWDDEDSETGRVSTPAQDQDDTATVTGLPFAPGLVLGYTISDEPHGQGSADPLGVRGAIGFSVATPDFQWCALVDGVDSRGAFQSFQRGFVDTVDGTDVHAGTVELTTDGFVLTTQEDSATANDWVWHAFGHPEVFPVWIPQSYRRR